MLFEKIGYAYSSTGVLRVTTIRSYDGFDFES